MTTRKYLASIILLAFAAMHGWACYKGYTPIISGIFSAGLVAGAAALIMRFFWARLFALGVATTGTVGCGVLLTMQGGGGNELFFYAQGAGFLLLGLSLVSREMAQQYEGQAGWTRETIREQLLTDAVVFNFAMLPMLIKYLGSDGEWVTDLTRAATAVTLATAGVALFLLLRRRTAGLLLLGAAGVGAMFLAVGALDGLRSLLQPMAESQLQCGTMYMHQAMQATETAMVVAGVVPGALAALICTLAFAGPMIRLIRS